MEVISNTSSSTTIIDTSSTTIIDTSSIKIIDTSSITIIDTNNINEYKTYYEISLLENFDIFINYVINNSLNSETNSLYESQIRDIEKILYHEYSENYMNEIFYIILISYGYKPNNDLFGYLVCGSIIDYISDIGIDNLIKNSFFNSIVVNNTYLSDMLEYYIDKKIIINGYDDLIRNVGSFISYTYEEPEYGHGQQLFQDALDNIVMSIMSFKTVNNLSLFKFKFNI
jgi:hypothetical protein